MKQELKFIKGKCVRNEVADIDFYTDVDYWSVDAFLWEFDYLVNNVCPSKIRIHINSAGGSCIEGISVFAKIMECSIPTECINDGLAASMGSVIWAAGDELYMKDYALLMIHNPFIGSENNKEYNQVTEAFTQQIKTIYSKRFGLSDEEVQSIMDGKEGDDGTFMTADQAVEKGFLASDHIIATSQAIKNEIAKAVADGKDVKAKINAVLNFINSDINNMVHNVEDAELNNKKMKKEEIEVFAALFGLTGDKATVENVTAMIGELKAKAEKLDATQASLAETKEQLTKAQAELAGAQTSVKNLTADLQAANAALAEYKDAEAKAQEEKVNALIDDAIANCKIDKEERDIYIKMAQNDFELAEKVLAKIPARDNLGNIIATQNKTNVNLQSEEEKVKAKVDEIVGKDFQFRNM